MRSGVIYLYTFPNGKVYVGQTRRDPQERHKEHFDPVIGRANSAFWNAYQEQGEPKYEILETHESEDKEELVEILNDRETYFIKKYEATNPEHGYNIRPTGTVSVHGESKIENLIGYYYSLFMEDMEPKWEAVLNKLDQVEKMNQEERDLYQEYFVDKNIFAFSDKDDETLYEDWIEYADFCFHDDFQTIAEEYVHENAATLLEEYVDENTIYQLDRDGNIINKYDSQIDAATAMGAKNAANINNVIRGKQKMAYGYKWVKAIDYENEQK